ncbi:MAG: hypothetical protein Q9224_000126 [Gallowayella concinna]
MASLGAKSLKRDDRRVIIHFDYDCFQKQIIVTCNYEARRHGLYKLQRVTEAQKKCPDAIIVLGEDLTRFRNASKENYDVTDMVDYNLEMLNLNSLQSSFFHLSRNDPTIGFKYDCSNVSGHTVPIHPVEALADRDRCNLYMRLMVGSHLAQHLRHQLEEHQGYSSTVGISTTKLISKLVGNVNKPKGQTTLLPPYTPAGESSITSFLDEHDIGKIPGIGFKSAQKIRDHVLARPAAFVAGLVYGGTTENVKVKDVRLFPAMGVELLEKLLGGSGAPKDLANKIWGLINGIDNSEVAKAREVPQQISIEDSYIRLDTMAEVEKELRMLSKSLLSRIRKDLSHVDDFDQPLGEEDGVERATNDTSQSSSLPRWLAYPKTLRLTTRPRPPLNPDGTRSRTFNRISRSCDMPSLVLNLRTSVEELSEILVQESLIPLFHKLHVGKSGWDLSLMNLCAANISLTAASSRDGAGRDISEMFKMQVHVLKDWKIEEDNDTTASGSGPAAINEDALQAVHTNLSIATEDEECIWQSDEEVASPNYTCAKCGLAVPEFAMTAHERFHDLPE